MAEKGKSVKPDEFERLLQRAIDSEFNSTPRKHHFVPNFYLKGWAEDKKIRVTHVDEGLTYVTTTGKAARKTDFYRMKAKDLDPTEVPPLIMEHVLGYIEEPAKEISDRLQSRGLAAMSLEDRYKFSLFLAVQMTRGVGFREKSRRAAIELARQKVVGRPPDEYENYLKKSGKEVTPMEMRAYHDIVDAINSGIMKVTPPEPLLIGMGFEMATKLGPHLLARRWEIFETPAVLITCDEPVVLIGGPSFTRMDRIGVANAGAVAFPLSPTALLLMFRNDVVPQGALYLDHIEVADMNREILANSGTLAFERPSKEMTMALKVPRRPEFVPAYTDGREGSIPNTASEFSFSLTSRWRSEPHHPWPVHRLWGRRS